LREELAIIVSPKPLKLPLGPPDQPARLGKAQVAQWERQWARRAERREEQNVTSKQWTAAERQADKGERRLTQDDPLPQTIYHIKVTPGAPMMLRLPLRIAPWFPMIFGKEKHLPCSPFPISRFTDSAWRVSDPHRTDRYSVHAFAIRYNIRRRLQREDTCHYAIKKQSAAEKESQRHRPPFQRLKYSPLILYTPTRSKIITWDLAIWTVIFALSK
jgi:hypothetical protein